MVYNNYFRDYNPPILQWQVIRGSPLPSAQLVESHSTIQQEVQELLKLAVYEKKWLLTQDQHVVGLLPPSHLDTPADLEEQQWQQHDQTNKKNRHHIYSMDDFVKQADQARDLDVQVCATTSTSTSTSSKNNKNNGQRRIPLSVEQLSQVYKTGELRVESVLFENQHHIWRVAPGFYSGTQTRCVDFRKGIGRMLDHLVVYTQDTFIGPPPPSTSNSSSFGCFLEKNANFKAAIVTGVGGTVQRIIDASKQVLPVGMHVSAYSEDVIATLLDLAEKSYVRHHLVSDASKRQCDVRRLYDDNEDCYTSTLFLHRHNKTKLENMLWDVLEEHWDEAPKCRMTHEMNHSSNLEADKAIASLMLQFEKSMKDNLAQDLALDEYKARKTPIEAIREMKRAQMDYRTKQERAWKDVLRDNDTAVTRNELDRINARDIERHIIKVDESRTREHLVAHEKKLQNRRPFMALSKNWLARKLEEEKRTITSSLQKTRLDRVAAEIQKTEGLSTQAEARILAIKFRKVYQSDLANKLHSAKTSFPPAEFHVLQLNPKNWTGPLGEIKHKQVKVDLSKPFWRVRYTWLTFVSSFKSMIGGSNHFLLYGPLSFRALCGSTPYFSSPDRSSLTPTLVSRIQSFYKALQQTRDTFEATPDRGLIGKSIQRIFLRGNLALKKVIGTTAITSFMVFGTFLASAINLVVLSSSPLLAAVYTLGTVLFNLGIYDTALGAARSRLNQGSDTLRGVVSESNVAPVLKLAIGVPWHLLFYGVLPGIMSLFRLLCHPAIAAVQLMLSISRYSLRTVRDSMTWTLVRKYSRVPAEDTFLACRIHGPGLAAKQYYRLPLEAAKASVLLFLDRYRLHAHATIRREELDAPYMSYRELFQSTIEPFGFNMSMKVPSPSTIGTRIASEEMHSNNDLMQHHRVSAGRSGIHEHVSDDIWDTLAKGICSSHPDSEAALRANVEPNWNRSGQCCFAANIDETIRADVDKHYQKYKSTGNSELDEMVNEAAKVWAELTLHLRAREQQLAASIAIPPHAAGLFRWSMADRDELWAFTLEAVDAFQVQLKEELQCVSSNSEFGSRLAPYVNNIIDEFYTKSGARPGQDVPTIASYLLVQLFGGENMLETLEEVDEDLVLHPKMAKEDGHLVFWRSIAVV